MKSKGIFLIFTSDMDSTPDDSLYHYRAKVAVEIMCYSVLPNMEKYGIISEIFIKD